MGVKPTAMVKVDNPGPGQYGPFNDNRGPKYGFGSESRSKGKSDAMPGPGAYKVPVRVADVPRYALPNRDETFKYV